MKAKVTKKYNNLSKGDTGEFVENSEWQGTYIGRKKPYGYFEFSNNSGRITRLSIKLVKESDCFEIITNTT